MSSKTAIFIVILIMLLFLLVFVAFQDNKYRNEIIKVNILLQNNCSLVDSAFMVTSYPGKKNSYFENKKAIMYLKRSSKIQLQASNKYDGFHYSSVPVKVKSKVILAANCTDEGRLDEIFNSIKKQFQD